MKIKIKKKIIAFVAFLALGFSLATKTFAVCPLCAVAVGAGVGLSRFLGIDDAITGLWVGGLIVSLIAWTLNWLDKKNVHFKGRAVATIVGFYALTVVPLYFTGMLGNKANSLFCWCWFYLDKLAMGIIVGSLGFWAGAELYTYLKARNNGKVYFPFQKVVMPIIPLIIASIIFYILIK